MLETVLNHLHNWFQVKGEARCGEFEIVSGELCADFLKPGQYYRIIGSVFNDGLHRYPDDEGGYLTDETFTGEVWPLAIPRSVIKISEEIKDWCDKNPQTDKISESFDGYSYTKGNAGADESGWQAVFRKQLNAWKKVS